MVSPLLGVWGRQLFSEIELQVMFAFVVVSITYAHDEERLH